MKILHIETSGMNCSVAISNNDLLIAEKSENQQKFIHSEQLHLFIEEVLKSAVLQLSEIDAIAVSAGPGSYTGLRIGVATAKGLCFALEKPLISVSTLQLLASQVLDYQVVIPLIDARRMEVYTAVFDKNYQFLTPTTPEILTSESFSSWLESGKVAFIGDGVLKFSEICHHKNAVFFNDGYPQARDMIAFATEKYKKNQFEDLAYFEPVYLK